jgi:hypothetical protein
MQEDEDAELRRGCGASAKEPAQGEKTLSEESPG